MFNKEFVVEMFQLMEVWKLVLVLEVLFIGVLPLGRGIFEGMAYNVSAASFLGDSFLIGIVAIGASLAQKYNLTGPISTEWLLLILLGACSIAAYMVTVKNPRMPLMDLYHHAVIFPSFVLLLALSCVALVQKGSISDWALAALFLLLWLILFIWDFKTSRLDQQKYLFRTLPGFLARLKYYK